MTKLYNPNAGLHGRKGGPFLDEVQNKQEEEKAALREGREPNFDNPPWRGPMVPATDMIKKLGNEWHGEDPSVEPVANTNTPDNETGDDDLDL